MSMQNAAISSPRGEKIVVGPGRGLHLRLRLGYTMPMTPGPRPRPTEAWGGPGPRPGRASASAWASGRAWVLGCSQGSEENNQKTITKQLQNNYILQIVLTPTGVSKRRFPSLSPLCEGRDARNNYKK